MRRLTSIAFLLLLAIAGHAQSHTLHVNASYLATQKPIFGFGYFGAPDSSHWAFGGAFEFGRFSYEETGVLVNAVDRYEEAGIGFRPEVRWYLHRHGEVPTGVFIAGYLNMRWFYASHITGERNADTGNVEYAPTQQSFGRQLRCGLQAGYRINCGGSGILVEGALGGGYLTNWPSSSLSAAPVFFQVDLNLVGLIPGRQDR